MDDNQNPNLPNFNRFPPSSSSSRPNPFNRTPITAFPPQIPRPYGDDDEDDDEDEEEPLEDEEDLKVRGFGDGVENDEQESSEESRGKRRRLDRFELAPRQNSASLFPTLPVVPPLQPVVSRSKPFARNPLADWTEDETFVLLEAWGDRFVQNDRKSLRSEEWNEVAKRVCQSSRIKRTDGQCRNRVDTLKKKYKKEKAKLSEQGNSSSDWIYFKKMDVLMTAPPSPRRQIVVHQQVNQHQQQHQFQYHQLQAPPPRLLYGVDAGEYVFTNSRVYDRVNGNDEARRSPGDTGSENDYDDDGNEDDSDGLPPRRGNDSWGSESSYRMLADSIQKFGEIYEKMENNKRQQMAELERMRNEFQRDLEVQKRHILERAQAEIARMREDDGEVDDEEDDDDDDGDDNGGSAENLSGFLAGSVYLTVFA